MLPVRSGWLIFTASAEKKKDDEAIQKMLLSVQATRMKIDSMGWIGFVKAQIDLGLCSFYIQST